MKSQQSIQKKAEKEERRNHDDGIYSESQALEQTGVAWNHGGIYRGGFNIIFNSSLLKKAELNMIKCYGLIQLVKFLMVLVAIVFYILEI